MAYGVVQGVIMNGSAIFKRRSSKKLTKRYTTKQQLIEDTHNVASIFRKPQESKKKGFKRLFSLKSRKESFPSLTEAHEYTWSLSDDSESVGGNRSLSSSWGNLSCSGSIAASPTMEKGKCVTLERKNKSLNEKKRCGNTSPSSSMMLSSPRVRAPNNLQNELLALQKTLNEFQKNEYEYRSICDEYEAFVQEQDAEIEKKESKIMHLTQMLEMKDGNIAKETQTCEDLRQSLSACQALCSEHECTIRAKDLKVSKRERELQQQKRVYATLVLQTQAATQKLQETIEAHESHIESLKAQLDAASKREGLQILQIETFNEELDAVSERYRLDSAKAEEKSQENQRRWTIYEESL